MKKIIALLICLIMALAVSACVAPPSPTGNMLEIHLVAKGYGKLWLENLIEAFKEDTDINVYLRETGTDDTFAANQVRNNTDIDIFITTNNTVFQQLAQKNFAPGYDKCWLDLSDVFDMKAEGYTESAENPNLKIKDIYDPDLLKAATFTDGKQYLMHHTTRVVGMVYHKTLLDETNAKLEDAGQPLLEIPRTTYEMWDLFERILDLKDESVPDDYRLDDFVYPFLHYNTMSPIPHLPWWGQYDGKAAMDNYVVGKDINGNYSPEFMRSDGKLYSIQNLINIFSPQYSNTTDKSAFFKDAQVNFLKKRAFFMFNGDWLEREVSQDFTFRGEVAFMKLPVMSEVMLNDRIKADFPEGITPANDEKLSKVIKFIDDFMAEHPNDCFDENGLLNIADKTAVINQEGLNILPATLDYLTESRRFTYSSQADDAVVFAPVYTKQAAEVKQFLQYMYSKKAQEIMMEAAYGLMCPVRVDMSQFDYYSDNPTALALSKLEVYKTGYVFSQFNTSPMRHLGGIHMVNFWNAYSEVSGKTAQAVLDKLYNDIKDRYPSIYNLAFGETWVNPYLN